MSASSRYAARLMPSPLPRTRLQQNKQQAVRNDIAEQAMRLFARNGFDATTIDAIAVAAEVSRRTFFRYFATKEDVVITRIDRLGQELGEALAARPKDESPLLAIRRALDPLVQFCMADPDHATMVAKLMRETPALRACHLDKQDRWQGHVAREVSRRLRPHAENELRPRVIAAAALGAFDVAFQAWTGSRRADLGALVDQAFAALAALAAPEAPPPRPRPRVAVARRARK